MTKQQIEKRIWELQVIMNLTHWRIGIIYDDNKPFDKIKIDCPALIIANSEYLYGELYFNPKKDLKRIDDDVLVHELCHCLTSELKGYASGSKELDSNWISYFDERLVSQIERIIIKGIR